MSSSVRVGMAAHGDDPTALRRAQYSVQLCLQAGRQLGSRESLVEALRRPFRYAFSRVPVTLLT